MSSEFATILKTVNYVMVDTGSYSVSQRIAKIFKGNSTKEKINELRKRLEAVISDLESVIETQHQEQQRQCRAEKVSVEVPVQVDLLGRKEEKEEIVSLLLDDKVTSVSIVGIGGLGKTTLALHVQSDPRIKEKFDDNNIRWVSMPAKFDLKAVAESILGQRLEDTSILHQKIPILFENLRADKSVLIVLDGLRDVTHEEWISFSKLFLPASTGCKVLITTHNPRVASKTSATRYLPLMGDEDCRDLVMDTARRVRGLSGRPLGILERNAETIAKMSKGLPLAASILGLCLSSRCCRDGAIDLSNVEIYDMREYKEEIFPRLNLNAADISSHLKRCLAYCSLFPRNHDFKKDSLVHLWMAEGFIAPEERREDLWEIGNKYFDDLHWRSFFQPSQPGLRDHEASSYMMHEFIHKFAELVATASGICFRWEDSNGPSDRWHEKVRHISFPCTSDDLDFKKIEKCEGLRTFLIPSEHRMPISYIPYSFLYKLTHLRVLDLSHTQVIEIPGTLGMLLFLRYLDLSETLITSLPESISKLLRLLVLKLKGCTQLLELPKDFFTFTSIQSLVHLEVDIKHLRARPASVGRLIHLQTLPIFFVGNEEGKRITELKDLNSLRGTLNLVDLENVEDEAEAREANLCEKQSLRTLELEWHRNFNDATKAECVFEGLEPHHNVKELRVTHYVGSSFPSWLTRQSCTLVSIEVKDCSVDDALHALGQLPYLKILHLEEMHCVTHMRYPDRGDINVRTFPSLTTLEIIDMKSLASWDELPPDNCMLELNKLTITDCPELSSVKSLNPISSLQTLEICRCPKLEALPQLPPSVQLLIIIESSMVKHQCQHESQLDMIRSIPKVVIDGTEIVFDADTPHFWHRLFCHYLFFCCLVLVFAILIKPLWSYYSAQKH